jgi:hypothetical protein
MATRRAARGLFAATVQRLLQWKNRRVWCPSQRQSALLLAGCLALLGYRLLFPAGLEGSPIPGVGGRRLLGLSAELYPPPWVGTPPPLEPRACRPQLLVIGAMKAGTTAIFHYLNGSHPALHHENGTKSSVTYTSRCEWFICMPQVVSRMLLLHPQHACPDAPDAAATTTPRPVSTRALPEQFRPRSCTFSIVLQRMPFIAETA